MSARHATGRLETFVDAVVAIAITLLVLPLADAATEADPSVLSLTDFLHEHRNTLAGFLLSFVVILSQWRAHHDLFEHLREYDTPLRSASSLWMLTIVITPFTTQLIVRYGDDPVGEALYIGVLLVTSLCQSFMAWHVTRHPDLLRPDRAGEPVRIAVPLAISALFVVALLLAVAVPGVDYSGLYVLLLTRPIVLVGHRLLGTRRRPVGSSG